MPFDVTLRDNGVGFDIALSPAAGDVTPPTIVIIDPPTGSTIGPSTRLKFRITDNVAIRRALPMVKFTDPNTGKKHYELIHDGDNFTDDYEGTRTVISGGFEYDVGRKGGWSAVIPHPGGSPELVPFAFDSSGNEPP